MRKLFLVGMSGLFVSYLSAASIPAQITYQGTLKQSGVPANGNISMEFKIINMDDSITYWNSQPISVPVTQGLFSQVLNPLNTLNPQNPLDWENTTPYIQVILNPGSAPITLAPAEPITTTMFSLVAGTVLDGSVSTQKLGDGAVTTVKLATASVTNAQLADMSVTSLAIANGAVGTPQLAALSVTSTTIADGAVTWQKIDPTTIPSGGLSLVPTGTILPFGGPLTAQSMPPGYLPCDGSQASRATYSVLFTLIGTLWGAGDGTSTFNLPDLRGRTPIGAGQGPGLTTRTLAVVGGEEMHTLTVNEMPAHNHGIGTSYITASLTSGAGGGFPSGSGNAITTSSTGGGAAHNIMQPYLVVNYIIKT